jgi:hypothetical protein
MTKGLGSKHKDSRVRWVRRLTAGQLHHCAPSWSPDGRVLCFTLGRGPDSHWLLTDRKGRAARVLVGPVVGKATVALDRSVAYGRQVGATAEIWLLPSSGSPPQRLLGGDGRLYRDPAFAPDGRLLCYAADEGSGGSDAVLKLWLLDLTRAEHTLLVAAPPTIPGASGPARLGRPAWSASGDHVFFEVIQGDVSAVGMVDVATHRTQLLTGPGFGGPAPVADGLLCVEQAQRDGQVSLCLLHYRPSEEVGDGLPAFKLRTAALAGLAVGAHEAAIAVGNKGVVHLAWVAPGRAKGGEPPRYDVHVGRLERLPALRLPRPTARPEAAEGEDDHSTVQRQSAAAAAGLAAAPRVSEKAAATPGRRAKRRTDREATASGPPAGDEAPADAERGV